MSLTVPRPYRSVQGGGGMTNAEYQTNRIAQGASLLASLNEVIQEHCREQGVETAFALRDALIDMHKADNTLRGYRAENMTESTMAVIGPIHGSEGTDMDAAYSQLSGPRFFGCRPEEDYANT
jgi:hypothetical protein